MRWALLLLLIWSFFTAFAQKDQDSLRAIQLLESAEKEHDNVDDYLKIVEDAIPLLRSTQQWDLYFKTRLNQQYVYVFDKLEVDKGKALALDYEKELEASKLENGFKYYHLNRLGKFHYKCFDLDKTIELYEKALEYASRNDETIPASTYNNLGAIYRKKGQVYRAKSYYKKALEAFERQEKPNVAHIAAVQHNLARFYQNLQEFEQAETYFLKAIETIKKASSNERNNQSLADFYKNLAFNFQLKGDYINTEKYISIGRNIEGLTKKRLVESDFLKAKNKLLQNQLEASLKGFNQLIGYYKKTYKSKHPQLAQIHILKSQILAKKDRLEAALSEAEKAITALCLDCGQSGIYQLSNKLLPGLEILDALHQKALLLEKMERSGVMGNYLKMDSLIFKFRNKLQGDDPKLLLSQKTKYIYETALAFASRNPTSGNIEKVFYLMESSKASVLLDNLIEAEAAGQSVLPERVLNLKRNIESELQILQKASSKEEDVLKLKHLNKLVFDLQVRQDSLLKRLDLDYPAYQQFKSQIPLNTIRSVQSKIDEAELFLEFFLGENKLYLLWANQKELGLQIIGDKAQVDSALEDFLYFFDDQKNIVQKPGIFEAKAKILSELLFSGLKGKLAKSSVLTIIPDGALAQIPFEALQLPEGEDKKYLLEKYQIRYGYSATLLNQQRTESAGNEILAMAPFAGNALRGLAQLEGSETELARFAKAKMNEAAQKSYFKEQAPSAQLIHLSTHAFSEGEPRIEFYEDSLSLRELYGMRLSANLAVLSACQTGRGAIQKGEGVMSLARGFRYAGAESLLMSLWSVNDMATSQIMQLFYDNLEEGKTKSEALHAAKLAYLNNPEIGAVQKSPFYWAALVFIGQDGTFDLPSTGFAWYWGILGLIILGAILVFYRKGS